MGDERTSSQLVHIFSQVISPPISLIQDKDSNIEDIHTIRFPDEFAVQIGGAVDVYDLLSDVVAFNSYPILVRKGIFDTLYLILRRGTYDVVRFRCHETESSRDGGIINILLNILNAYYTSKNLISLSKRIIRILGILCSPSLTPAEFKRFLKFLRFPSLISNSLLHALKTMIRQDDSIVKSAPVSFFNFGGIGSGLYSYQNSEFIKNEFQICMWFRIETFRSSTSNVSEYVEEEELISCVNKNGFKLYMREKRIFLDVIEPSGSVESFGIEGFQTRKGVWYHLIMTHSRPRFALFHRSKICLKVDGVILFDHLVGMSDNNTSKMQTKSPISPNDAQLVIGKNFDGQIGAVYFFLEPLPTEAIDVISRLNARKHVDGYHGSSSIDLLPIVYILDGKTVTISPSILAVYHPSRVFDAQALDVHSGRHAILGKLTYAWNMRSARDVLVSLGGVTCLLPLFPRLLIENDVVRNQVVLDCGSAPLSTGLGTSLADIYDDIDCYQYLCDDSIEVLSIDKIEVSDEGCIGLLLAVLSRCVQAHPVYLHNLAVTHGIGMIEYALSNVSDKILGVEGDTCAVALLELKHVVGGSAILENSAIKHLLSNFKVWSKASPFFQKSLISILHTAAAEQPEFFIRTVGVHWFLDQVLYFVPLAVPKDDASENTSIATTSPSEIQVSPRRGRRFGSIVVSAEQMEGSDSVLSDAKQALAYGSRPNSLRNMSNPEEEVQRTSPKHSRFIHALNKAMGEESDAASNSPVMNGLDLSGKLLRPLNKESDNQHKFYMRNNLYSILYLMVQNDADNKELESMFSFMDKCKDSTVLNEVCQLVLCFIIEMGESALHQIISACSTPEGFTSFLIFRLISHPSEQVRSTAIRLLTHFYQRLKDTATAVPKTNIMSMAHVFEVQKSVPGIMRLQDSGSLHLVSKMLENKYCADSSLPTYSALLEMLVTMYGSSRKLYKYADADKNSENAGKLSKNGALRVFALAPFSLSHAVIADEREDGVNECILSHFFTIVPKLHESIEDTLYQDLMSILKQSSESRDVFCSNPHWNTFIYLLAKRYVIMDNNTSLIFRSDDIISCIKGSSEDIKGSPPRSSISPAIRTPLRISIDDFPSSAFDTRFAMCMRVNSTLAVHATKYKNGWLSIFRSLVVMQDAPERSILTQSLLSQVVIDLTFGLPARFRDLMNKVVSDVAAVKQDAYDQLENFLVLIILLSASTITSPVGVMSSESTRSWKYLQLSDIKPELVDSKVVSKEIPQFMEILLHPLERNHNVDHGRLVLSLQCLRFFDVMFSPSESGLLRNGQILKYCVRQIDKKATNDQRRERMSLLSAAIRMCVYVQIHLCPLTELAIINLRRLSNIVKTMDKVPKNTTPLDAWSVVILQNSFQTMLQLRQSFLPLFEELGFSSDLGEFLANDEELYETMRTDITMLTKIEGLFDSKIGARLIAYIKELSALIIDVFKSRKDTFPALFGDALFQSFSRFVAISVESLQLSGKRGSTSGSSKRARSRSGTGNLSNDMSLKVTISGLSDKPDAQVNASKGEWGDVSDSASVAESDHAKDTYLCDDIVAIFRALRDPVFNQEMNHLDSVISAFEIVKHSEKRGLFDVMEDLSFLRSRAQSVENSVGRNLGSMPTWSSSARVQKMAEMTLAKSVASSWQSILKTFEAEWSPWHSTEDEGLRCYELSRHVDRFSRRIVLTRVSDTIDHSGAQYYSSKRKMLAEASTVESSINESLLALPSSFLRDALKLTMDSRKQNIVEDWGNENSFIFEENTQSLQEKRPIWALNVDWASDEYIAYTSEATTVGLECSMSGTILLTNKHLYFHPRKQVSGMMSDSHLSNEKTRIWVLESLCETYGRRHLLKNCGIELFFLNSPEVFFAFKSLKELQQFFFTLRRLNVPNLVSPATLNPKQVCASLNWTEMWRRRLISNFEYLIILNKMAGRSFNDLTQYPVFPWIIADYTSQQLDLSNPATFRDLSKPIGALNEARLQEIMERYNNSFDDVDTPKFMYGSHYSSAGVVLHYLIRQEPFTTLAVNFQGGKFDCPDRLFFDFQSTWDSLNYSQTDVKELIPEFFCCPEMLLNTNKLPLGPLQDGITHVNDVILPPWAKDAFDFVSIQRAALESEYVSANLHHWIDLIFGYKQTGYEAIEAKNLFYYLTYENSINIDEIADPMTRDATISQVTNFGQTPSQLFVKPHVHRMGERESVHFLFSNKQSVANEGADLTTYAPQLDKGKVAGPIIAVQNSKTQIIVYHSDLSISYFKFALSQDGYAFPQKIQFDKSRRNPCASLSMRSEQSIRRCSIELDVSSVLKDIEPTQMDAEESIASGTQRRMSVGLLGKIGNLFGIAEKKKHHVQGTQFQYFDGAVSDDTLPSSQLVALSLVDGSSGRVVSCGYWDNSLRVHSLDTLREIVSVNSGHVGAINCLQIDRQGGNLVITGGADGTCRVWLLESYSSLSSFYADLKPKGVDNTHDDPNLVCVHVLCGHQTPITCLSYSADMDVLLSGSKDGTLCLHSVRSGSFIRLISKLQGNSIDVVYTSAQGYLIVHSWSAMKLWLFWVNGQELATSDHYISPESTPSNERLECFAMNGPNADVLVCGGNDGKIYFLDVASLAFIRVLDVSANGAVKTLRFSDDNQYLMIGSRNGTLSICMDASRHQSRLLDKSNGGSSINNAGREP